MSCFPGGKSGAGVFQTIINLIPPHSVYIEAFLGGGAVLRLKRPARINIGVDLDSKVIADWKKPGATLIESLGLARPGDASSRAPGAPEYRFICGDGAEFLAAYPWEGSELVYCDPPYLMRTRSQSDRLYRCEMTDAGHVRLLDVLNHLPCKVLLSGYYSDFYGAALKGWNSVNYRTMTRGGGQRIEWLWFNFATPVELHDYRYLGAGYRERERINRKRRRWAARLTAMPLLERQAMLAAIADTWGALSPGLASAPGPAGALAFGGGGYEKRFGRRPPKVDRASPVSAGADPLAGGGDAAAGRRELIAGPGGG